MLLAVESFTARGQEMVSSENTHRWGMITVQLVSSLKRLDLTNKENMLLFVYSEAVKLETSSTVILPPYSECSLHGALS